MAIKNLFTKGVDLDDEVFKVFCRFKDEYFPRSFRQRFDRLKINLKYTKALILSAEHILDRFKPSVAVLDQDRDEIKKMFTLVCRKNQAKTAVVCHGIPPATHALVATPLFADMLLVGGEDVRMDEWLRPDAARACFQVNITE